MRPLTRRDFVTGALSAATLSSLLGIEEAATHPSAAEAAALGKPAGSRPNIVVILVDDMGYSDIGCYGGEISTPNLDKLASEGVRFTEVYNTARCCPSRAALLTGLYSHQAGVGHMTEAQHDDNGNVLPGYSGHLNDHCVTIAEALKGAGYFTAMAGKWHVGQNAGVTPWGRGFDRSLNSVAGGFYFPETPGGGPLWLNGKSVGRTDDPLPKHWYSTDLWVEYGLKFVDDARAAHKPFFLYVPFNAPHFPLQAPAEDIARWRGKYRVGWDKLREARYQRQIKMGIIDPKWPLSPRLPLVPAWDSLTPDEQDRYDHIMAIYAAVVEHMDKAVGNLVAGLKERGELDNTLILFLSDNGGNAESGPHGRLEGENPGDPHSTVFEGQCWATLSNTPLVRYKHYTDEGGIATPLIAHWPQGIPAARNGKLEPQVGHIVDIMATCVDVAGATYPTTFQGKPITPMQGVSLQPGFRGKPLGRKQPIFWEHEENRAVHDGKWKIVALAHQPWRLYDLEADRTEQNDLAAKMPEKVKIMDAQWNAWAARSNVLPLGGWHADEVRGDAGGKKGKKGGGAFSKETHFSLKAGEHLARRSAPDVANRAFTVTAKFDTTAGQDGVLVAQGGLNVGYAIYLKEGKATFVVRNDGGTAASASALEALSRGSHVAVARLAPDGAMTLTLDGKVSATAKAQGLLASMPIDGLDVGSDEKGAVGPYAAPNPFQGKIESVTIQLDPMGKAAGGEELD